MRKNKKRDVFIILFLVMSIVVGSFSSCVNQPDTPVSTDKTAAQTGSGLPGSGGTGKAPADLSALEKAAGERKSGIVKTALSYRFTTSFENSAKSTENIIEMPEITLAGIGALSVNEKIAEIYGREYGEFKTYDGGHKSMAGYAVRATYDYSYFAGILTVILTDDRTYPDGSESHGARLFYYDTALDMEITFGEYLEFCSVNKNDLYGKALSGSLLEGDIFGGFLLPDGSFKCFSRTKEKFEGSFYSKPLGVSDAKRIMLSRGYTGSGVIFDAAYDVHTVSARSLFSLSAPDSAASGSVGLRKKITESFYEKYADEISGLTAAYYGAPSDSDAIYYVHTETGGTGDFSEYRVLFRKTTLYGTLTSETKYYYDKEADMEVKSPKKASELIKEMKPAEADAGFLKYYCGQILDETPDADKTDISIRLGFEKGSESFAAELSFPYFSQKAAYASAVNEAILSEAERFMKSLGDASPSNGGADPENVYSFSVECRENRSPHIVSFAAASGKDNTQKIYYYDCGAEKFINIGEYLALFGTDKSAILEKTADALKTAKTGLDISYVFINDLNNDTYVFGKKDGVYASLAFFKGTGAALERINEIRASSESLVTTAYESHNGKSGYSFKVPGLAVNSGNAEKLNAGIMKDFNDLKDRASASSAIGAARAYYGYAVSGGNIRIDLYFETTDTSGTVFTEKRSYCYSVTEDRTITQEEFAASYPKDGDPLGEAVNRAYLTAGGDGRMVVCALNLPFYGVLASGFGIADGAVSRISVPAINSSRKNALLLNQRIKLDIIGEFESGIADVTSGITDDAVYDLSYTYTVSDGYVTIELFRTAAVLPDGVRTKKTYYFYDFENDLILTKIPENTGGYDNKTLGELSVGSVLSVADSLEKDGELVFPIYAKEYRATDGENLVRIAVTVPCFDGGTPGADVLNGMIVGDLLGALAGFGTISEAQKMTPLDTLESPYAPFGYVGSAFDSKRGIMLVVCAVPGEKLPERYYKAYYADVKNGKMLTESEYLSICGTSVEKIKEGMSFIPEISVLSEDPAAYLVMPDGCTAAYLTDGDGNIVKAMLEKEREGENFVYVPGAFTVSREKRWALIAPAASDTEKCRAPESSVIDYYYTETLLPDDDSDTGEKARLIELLRAEYEKASDVPGGKNAAYRFAVIGGVLEASVVSSDLADGIEKTAYTVRFDTVSGRIMTDEQFAGFIGSVFSSEMENGLFESIRNSGSNDLYIDVLRSFRAAAFTEDVAPMLFVYALCRDGSLYLADIRALTEKTAGAGSLASGILTDFFEECHAAISSPGQLPLYAKTYYETEKKCVTVSLEMSGGESQIAHKKFFFDAEKHVTVDEKTAEVLKNYYVPDAAALVGEALSADGEKVVAAYDGRFLISDGDGQTEAVLRFPVINSDAPGAALLSEKIVGDLIERYAEAMNFYAAAENAPPDGVIRCVDFEYTVSGNIIIICVTGTGSLEGETLPGHCDIYYYDEEKQEEMTLGEYIESTGADTEELLSKLNSGAISSFLGGYYGGLYKLKLRDLAGVVIFENESAPGYPDFDVYIKTPEEAGTVKVSLPERQFGDWLVFTSFAGLSRTVRTGLVFADRNWNATKRSSTIDGVYSDTEYGLFYTGKDTACVTFGTESLCGFCLIDVRSGDVLSRSAVTPAETASLHGIETGARPAFAAFDISVGRIYGDLIVCNYEYQIDTDTSAGIKEASGVVAASFKTETTEIFPGDGKAGLCGVDFDVTLLQNVKSLDDMKKLAEAASLASGAGEFTEDGFYDSGYSLTEYTAGAISYKYESYTDGEKSRSVTVSLDITDGVYGFGIPHGIRFGDSIMTVLDTYGYDVDVTGVASVMTVKGSVFSGSHVFIKAGETEYYLVWESADGDVSRRIALEFSETGGETDFVLTSVGYMRTEKFE